MSLLTAVREYISKCPFIDDLSADNIHIDFNSEEPHNISLSQNGDQLIKKYISGAEIRQASFGIYIKNFTFDDTKRLENNAFCERFIFWNEDNSRNEIFPVLDTGLAPEIIKAENGMLFDINENGDIGTYQIQINLIYRRN